jgi:hypothetical protein
VGYPLGAISITPSWRAVQAGDGDRGTTDLDKEGVRWSMEVNKG